MGVSHNYCHTGGVTDASPERVEKMLDRKGSAQEGWSGFLLDRWTLEGYHGVLKTRSSGEIKECSFVAVAYFWSINVSAMLPF